MSQAATLSAPAHVRLPARYDHVGSFLRPAYLLEARAQHRARARSTLPRLRAVEDRAIAEIVRFQESVGMKAMTDGEYRRNYFHIDFLDQLGGVQTTPPVIVKNAGWHAERWLPPVMHVVDKVRHVTQHRGRELPLPEEQAHGRAASPKSRFPRRRCCTSAAAAAASAASPTRTSSSSTTTSRAPTAMSCARCTRPVAATCRWTTPTSPICAIRRCAKRRASRGDDPNELPRRYADFINRVVAQKPAGMLLGIHLCRGNFRSTFAASGDYEPVAEALFAEMNVDAYFLEYDDDRSGDFRPLRFLPKGKTAVLGLISSKFGEMESMDDLKRRIDEAAQYAPLDQLALSPQCGFASTAEGNDIAWDAQRRKMELVVKVAREVWGER